tara:strand:- start:1204 stop:1455 length:252 start_codon:yes stop_codon:yes gene_type:complete
LTNILKKYQANTKFDLITFSFFLESIPNKEERRKNMPPTEEEEVELSPCLCLIYILSVLIMYPYLSELQENNPDFFTIVVLLS